MDIKRLKRKPVSKPEPNAPMKPRHYAIIHSFDHEHFPPRFYETPDEATEALRPGDLGVFKLIRRAKFNKVVEDVA